jgi:hypothetical protein
LYRKLGGLQSTSGRLGEEKILDPTGTRNSDPSVIQPVVSRYTDYAINPLTLFAATAHLVQGLIQRTDAKSYYIRHVTRHDVVSRMIQKVTKKYMGDKNYRNLIE